MPSAQARRKDLGGESPSNPAGAVFAPLRSSCIAGSMRIAENVTFGGSRLDRAADLRREAREALAGEDAARFVPFWRLKPLIAEDALVRVPRDHDILKDAGEDFIFLGRDRDGPLFAVPLDGWVPEEAPDPAAVSGFLDASRQTHPAVPHASFAELRAVMTLLDARDAELAATARALLGWHGSHRFCANCGEGTQAGQAGWQRDCTSCGRHHFPRTDPVVIMLVTHGNDVLLGRSPGWPEGMYSLLAGFIEPGETLEAAVRREVYEETRVEVGAVEYLASQPWPFPASLMLGCRGTAESREITIDPVEIEDAIWLSREELADVFAGQNDRILPAREGAIAHFLLRNWLADKLD